MVTAAKKQLLDSTSVTDGSDEEESSTVAVQVVTVDAEEGTTNAANKTGANANSFRLWKETTLLVEIAAPAVMTQCAVFLAFPMTASAVGRQLGTDALAGFSLGSLTANLTLQSILTGSLTAADTLMPRAFAAQKYRQVGILAVRSMLVCTVLLLVPLVPLLTMMEPFFLVLGQDPTAATLAAQWIQVFLLGVPALLGFKILQSFLNAQHRPWPLAISSILATCVLPLWIWYMVPTWHERGSALAIAVSQWVMVGILLIQLRLTYPHSYVPESWPGITKATLMKALDPRPMKEYMGLSLGGVVSLSEWWFWEINCFVVGSFGVVPLCAHTIAYNLVPLLFMPTLGLAIGLTVRMGHVLAHNVHAAKRMAAYSLCFNTAFGTVLVLALYQFRYQVATMFTDDPEVIRQCEAIWPKLCIFVWILHPFGIQCAIMRALGMQWRMATVIFFCLYCSALPALFFFAVHKGGGIGVVWTILPIAYAVMQVGLASCYVCENWSAISRAIQEQSQSERSTREFTLGTAEESQSLLMTPDSLRNGPSMLSNL